MEGIFFNTGNTDLSAQEVFNRFIKEKECANLAPDTIAYYHRCFVSFRQVL